MTWAEPGRFLSLGAALSGEQAGGLVDIVDAVDQFTHRPPVTEPLQQWPSRVGVGPVLTAHQDQWSDEAGIGGVEVLRCSLKDFLYGAGPPWKVDDAAPAAAQQSVLPQRVGEILGDLGGEGLVAVEPGGDTEAAA